MEDFEPWGRLMFALAIVVVGFAPSETLSAPLKQTLPGCNSTCGNIEIPYPFGVGYSSSGDKQPCSLGSKFSLTCNNSILKWGKITVLNISIVAHEMDVSFWVSRYCGKEDYSEPWMTTGKFKVSNKKNKFLTVGCDSYGYLDSVYEGKTYSTGCLTRCYGNNLVIEDGTCSGIGCCEVEIPPRMRNITVKAAIFPNSRHRLDRKKCSHSFVVKRGSYNFSRSDIISFPNETLPLVIDWTAGAKNCNGFKTNRGYYACKENSDCDDKDADFGYRCRCKDGYQGNPYLGCTDIDECKIGNHTCTSEKNCLNIDGSHQCFCPEGHSGNGTKEAGCHKKDVVTKVVTGVGAGIVILSLGTTLIYLTYQKKKLNKLREKYFQQNGGSILLQKLSKGENSSQIQIYTEEQLKKATKNFDESLIIGRGGFGTVFKGHLTDNRTVAVKKSKIVDNSQNEQFANEVLVLSQINHRNVVKLLGCCLETEVPLLVYEFVNNGTLFDFVHTERKVNDATWKTRLRIAAEAAGALSYLHSEASTTIIHRDVKTANILLDNTYTAKVSDFGASRLVPLDKTEIATMVQGTFGYLDPEYMRTSQLTEKSDVYSFGVVLVELLTGEKPYSFGKPEEKRSLTNHFLSCLKEDRLFDVIQVGIMNEENKKEIMEVAILAAKCLRLNGEERPTMKEVAMELDGMKLTEKHPWINTFENPEKDHLLQKGSSSIGDTSDSSIHQYTGYDSINDHVQVAFDDGR